MPEIKIETQVSAEEIGTTRPQKNAMILILVAAFGVLVIANWAQFINAIQTVIVNAILLGLTILWFRTRKRRKTHNNTTHNSTHASDEKARLIASAKRSARLERAMAEFGVKGKATKQVQHAMINRRLRRRIEEIHQQYDREDEKV